MRRGFAICNQRVDVLDGQLWIGFVKSDGSAIGAAAKSMNSFRCFRHGDGGGFLTILKITSKTGPILVKSAIYVANVPSVSVALFKCLLRSLLLTRIPQPKLRRLRLEVCWRLCAEKQVSQEGWRRLNEEPM